MLEGRRPGADAHRPRAQGGDRSVARTGPEIWSDDGDPLADDRPARADGGAVVALRRRQVDARPQLSLDPAEGVGGIKLSVSVTTRPRRPSEIEGCTTTSSRCARFEQMRDHGELLESGRTCTATSTAPRASRCTQVLEAGSRHSVRHRLAGQRGSSTRRRARTWCRSSCCRPRPTELGNAPRAARRGRGGGDRRAARQRQGRARALERVRLLRRQRRPRPRLCRRQGDRRRRAAAPRSARPASRGSWPGCATGSERRSASASEGRRPQPPTISVRAMRMRAKPLMPTYCAARGRTRARSSARRRRAGSARRRRPRASGRAADRADRCFSSSAPTGFDGLSPGRSTVGSRISTKTPLSSKRASALSSQPFDVAAPRRRSVSTCSRWMRPEHLLLPGDLTDGDRDVLELVERRLVDVDRDGAPVRRDVEGIDRGGRSSPCARGTR